MLHRQRHKLMIEMPALPRQSPSRVVITIRATSKQQLWQAQYDIKNSSSTINNLDGPALVKIFSERMITSCGRDAANRFADRFQIRTLFRAPTPLPRAILRHSSRGENIFIFDAAKGKLRTPPALTAFSGVSIRVHRHPLRSNSKYRPVFVMKSLVIRLADLDHRVTALLRQL